MDFDDAIENQPASRVVLYGRVLRESYEALSGEDRLAVIQLLEEMESPDFQEDSKVRATQHMARVLH